MTNANIVTKEAISLSLYLYFSFKQTYKSRQSRFMHIAADLVFGRAESAVSLTLRHAVA
jgi:hypothetical protein